MQKKVQLKQLKFNLPVEIFKEGGYFIARTPALDLAVQGRTKKEVRDRFVESVVVFFEELADLGTADEVLHGLGWEKVDSQWQPVPVTLETLPVEVQVRSLA